MKVEIDLSTQAISKIRALSTLSGGDGTAINALISRLVEDGLNRIGASILDGQVSQHQQQYKPPVAHYTETAESAIEGLGDLDEEVEAPVAKKATAKGGITEDDLAADMELDDPEWEAKVDSPTFRKPKTEQAKFDEDPEETFSQLALGVNFPDKAVEPGYVDHRVAKRKKVVGGRKAKVSPFDGTNLVESSL